MRLEHFVQFAQADMGQVMFFSRYLEVAHMAYERFVSERLAVQWNDWFKHPDWLIPFRSVNLEYFSPLHPGRNFITEYSIQEIGKTSFTHRCAFYSSQNIAAQVIMTSVFVERATGKKGEIPADLRARLENCKANNVVRQIEL